VKRTLGTHGHGLNGGYAMDWAGAATPIPPPPLAFPLSFLREPFGWLDGPMRSPPGSRCTAQMGMSVTSATGPSKLLAIAMSRLAASGRY